MKKLKSRKSAQLEVQWSEPESFTLITQRTVDGDRLAKESAQHDADLLASAELQNQLL